MDIPASQISYKKIIGKMGANKVFEIGTMGGLVMVVLGKASPEVAGIAPHAAISKFIAQKKFPDIEYTELSKSEYVDPRHFALELPKYEELTNKLRKLQGLK